MAFNLVKINGAGDGTRTRDVQLGNFARTIDAAKKYVVSSTLDLVDWNAELVRGDLAKAVKQLKRESGKGLFVRGVKLPARVGRAGIDRGVPSWWCGPG
jgi:hypothetical protein